jgi:hypothetical protein
MVVEGVEVDLTRSSFAFDRGHRLSRAFKHGVAGLRFEAPELASNMSVFRAERPQT